MRSSYQLAVIAALSALPTAGQTPVLTDMGVRSVDKFGYSVRAVGDVDGDGIDDYIYSAPFTEVGSLLNAGLVRLRSGATGALLYEFLGDARGDEFGYQVNGCGDVDGDGRGDFVITELIGSAQFQGAVHVYSGRTGAVLHSVFGTVAYDYLGVTGCGAGDLNADGYDDFMVGVPGRDDNGSASGELRAYSGRTGSLLWQRDGERSGDQFGWYCSEVGDVDGDGRADVVVGAPTHDAGSVDSGRVYLLSGLNGSTIRHWDGPGAGSRFGWNVSGAGDVNGDDVQDVVAGGDRNTNLNGTQAGVARVFSGADGSVLHTWYGDGPGDALGWSVRDAGDLDNDGFGDVIVGAPHADTANGVDSGLTRILSGATGQPLLTILGRSAGDWCGFSAAIAGDRNLDGYPDLVVGSIYDDLPGTDAGSITVYELTGPGSHGRMRIHGVACTTSIGTLPRASGSGRAAIGDSYKVHLRGGLPSAPAFLSVGVRWELPLDAAAPGCTVYSYPLVVLGTTTDMARVTTINPFGVVPNNPSFIGAQIEHQWLLPDPAANPLGIVTSDDLVVTLGQ